MKSYRAVLEVLKFCSPRAVLGSLCIVDKCWIESASSLELWGTFLEDLGVLYHPSEHPKTTYCQNFHPQKSIVSLSKFFLTYRDPETGGMKSSKLTAFIEDKGYAYTVLWDGSVLCCGGVHKSESSESLILKVLRTVQVINSDGKVVSQPCLLYPRQFHGIVAYDRKVFVFGGIRVPKRVDCQVLQNEVFDHTSWSPLPDLPAPRYNFAPCVHMGLIYLCGGYNNSVLTFLPLSSTFEPLDDLILPQQEATIAAVHKGCLVVFTKTTISRWDMGKKTLEVSRKVEEAMLGRVRAVVFGDLLYVGSRIIDMETGKQS